MNRVEWKIILLFKSSNCISCWSVEQLKSPPTDSRLTKLDPRNSIGTHSTPISPVYRVASKLQFFPSSHAAWTLFLLTLCCVGKSNFISIAGPQLEIGTIDVEKVNDFNSPGVSCRENVQFRPFVITHAFHSLFKVFTNTHTYIFHGMLPLISNIHRIHSKISTDCVFCRTFTYRATYGPR